MRVDTKLIPKYLKSLECRLWLSAVLEFLLMVLLYLGGGNPCPNGKISFSRIPQALKHQIWNIAQVTVFWSPWINCANVALLTDLSNATASQVSNAEVSHTLEVDPERIQQLPSEQRFTASGPMADGNRTGKEAKGCKDGKAKSSRWPEVRKTYKHNSPATSHMLAATARWLNFTFREVFCTNFSWRKNTLQLVAWTANKKWSSRWSINTLPPVKRGSRVSRMRESNNLNSGPAIWRNSPLERAIRKAPVVKSVSPWPSEGGRFCWNVWNTCAFVHLFCKPLVFKLLKQQPKKISTWLRFMIWTWQFCLCECHEHCQIQQKCLMNTSKILLSKNHNIFSILQPFFPCPPGTCGIFAIFSSFCTCKTLLENSTASTVSGGGPGTPAAEVEAMDKEHNISSVSRPCTSSWGRMWTWANGAQRCQLKKHMATKDRCLLAFHAVFFGIENGTRMRKALAKM